MRTNIDLNEALVKQAFKYASVKTKKDLIHIALQEFIANHQRKDVRELLGIVSIAKDYDYKSMRK